MLCRVTSPLRERKTLNKNFLLSIQKAKQSSRQQNGFQEDSATVRDLKFSGW
jgi:hypothetical protein